VGVRRWIDGGGIQYTARKRQRRDVSLGARKAIQRAHGTRHEEETTVLEPLLEGIGWVEVGVTRSF
jgi:hypothetical protein